MRRATPTLDGDWQITGLPPGSVVVIFTMSQIDAFVTGAIDITNGQPQSFGVSGNNNHPKVVLDFNQGGQPAFSFQGSFTDDNTVTGTLSGQFAGPATLTRAS